MDILEYTTNLCLSHDPTALTNLFIQRIFAIKFRLEYAENFKPFAL